jgi:hypothetical protein
MFFPRIGIAIIACLFYLGLPTKNYYWDGISFAQAIEDAKHWDSLLFHPNHLIYNTIGWAVYKLFGSTVRALYILQLLNSICASVTIYVLSGILAATTKCARTAVLLSALFAFSGTWWRFSTDANAYILSVMFLTCAARLLTGSRRARPMIVALLHTAAMLIHELSFLFMPAAVFMLWKTSGLEGRKRLLTPALYAGVAGVATIATYALAFGLRSGRHDLRAFLAWITSHAEDAAFTLNILKSIPISIRSWFQLFLAGRPSALQFSSPLTIALLATSAGVLALFIRAVWRRNRDLTARSAGTALEWRGGFRISIQEAATFQFAGIWFATYALFLLFWLPNNTFYKLFALPAVLIATGSCWKPGRLPDARGPVVLFVILIGLVNLTFAIVPYSNDNANGAVAFAMSLRSVLEEGSIVYFHNFNTDDWFARYFNPSTQWKHTDTTATIDADLRRGNSVWLETTAIDEFSRNEPQWLSQRMEGAKWHELVNKRHRIRFVRLSHKNMP